MPLERIVALFKTGAVNNIISGLSIGFESVLLPTE
jgi:Na+/H+-translocating membrane pyrophosphatase